MRPGSLVTREKLAALRNFGQARVFEPRLIASANRLAREAEQRSAIQKRSEFAPFLALLLRRPPRRVIEIGRGSGGSLWALCQAAADDATIVSVDLPEGPYGGLPDDPQILARHDSYARPGQELVLVQGDSTAAETLEAVHRAVTDVDLLFIDGDHTFAGVKADYEAYAPLVQEGGLVALHDILPHDAMPEVGVHRFWAALGGSKIELVSPAELAVFGGRWGGIGVLVVSRAHTET
ncbi:MAG TPA: class I SAM-dependent methyltransferase [Gaiellaceae bacterium]|nr:class I SAM-dependent methyltransferase [Gaiellaceae bacterium]